MKRILLLLLCSINLCCWGQDIIVTRESQRIDAKVVEVSDTEVRYKKSSNLDGPVFVISTNRISSILYANGEVQMFEPATPQQNQNKATITEHVVSFEPLYREGNQIVTRKSYPYEPENLRELLGRDGYGEYLSAQGQYGRGATCVAFGWIDLGVSIPLTIIGYRYIAGASNAMATSSEPGPGGSIALLSGIILGIASDVLLPVGYSVRGAAAGRISRIAEGYNAEQNRHLSMEMGFTPTLLLASDGTAAPGIGLSLRF